MRLTEINDQLLGEGETFRFRKFIDLNGPEARPGLGPCHLWTGARNNKGCAWFWFNGRPRIAARLVLEQKLGRQLLPGMETLHACDVRHCVNPDHLSEGTHRQNRADCVAWGRTNAPKGAAHPRGSAKLSEADIQQVLNWRRLGRSQSWIATRLNVTRSAIALITQGKRWRHVTCA